MGHGQCTYRYGIVHEWMQELFSKKYDNNLKIKNEGTNGDFTKGSTLILQTLIQYKVDLSMVII